VCVRVDGRTVSVVPSERYALNVALTLARPLNLRQTHV
jgi:hypothetical protein